ncbi:MULTISPECIES: DUF642 domain-containing protein [unclassified Streptomyces]|uniref:DUF642 domain-containing protein n=1 Tax=unclassified Streptomyces TaxID=2593676 RepID=UPI00367D3415
MPRTHRVLLVAGTLLACGTATQPPATAADHNLVNNGTFSRPAAPDTDLGHRRIDSDNAGELPEWRLRSGDIDIVGRKLAGSPSYHQAANLTGGSPGSIEQSFETTVGQRYVIRWEHSRETWPGCDEIPEQPYTVEIVANKRKRFVPPEQGERWGPASLQFLAEGEEETLRFSSASPPESGHCGAMITNVKVVPFSEDADDTPDH